MTSNANPGVTASNLSYPTSVFSDGTKMYVADSSNNRVLIWNAIPVANTQAAANLVLGQPNMTNGTDDYPSYNPSATNMDVPWACLYRRHEVIRSRLDEQPGSDLGISIPNASYVAANIVLGQSNFTSWQAGGVSATSLNMPYGIYSNGTSLFVSDAYNNLGFD